MTDIIIVSLLLVIIFLLLCIIAPEIGIYLMFGGCTVVLAILGIIGLILFIQDPVGCLYNLLANNPAIVFENTLISAIPTYGGEVVTPITINDPTGISLTIGLIAVLCIMGWIFVKDMLIPLFWRRDDWGDDEK